MSILLLPPEVLVIIFYNAKEKNAQFVCQSFYNVFKSNSELILRAINYKKITIENIPPNILVTLVKFYNINHLFKIFWK